MSADEPIIEVSELMCDYPIRGGLLRRPRGAVHAVRDVSFRVDRGTAFALVGESGSGKSTLIRTLNGLFRGYGGSVRVAGREVSELDARELARLRADVQMVFQDPYSSLNPRLDVGGLVSEGWRVHPDRAPSGGRDREIRSLLSRVGLDGLDPATPVQGLSGGQRQRVAIARALALRPVVLLCDEPTSALDASVQAQVLDLLDELRRSEGMSYVFVSHDLAVVQNIADTVGVLYLGRMVEQGAVADVLTAPRHPYARALLSVATGGASSGGVEIVLGGEIPSPANPPSGCGFRTRCWLAHERCALESPPVVRHGESLVACHLVES